MTTEELHNISSGCMWFWYVQKSVFGPVTRFVSHWIPFSRILANDSGQSYRRGISTILVHLRCTIAMPPTQEVLATMARELFAFAASSDDDDAIGSSEELGDTEELIEAAKAVELEELKSEERL